MSAVPAAMQPAAPAADTLAAIEPESAQMRLARSRAAIAGWLAADEAERAAPSRPGGLPGWLKRLRLNPLAAFAVDALTDRWAKHPLAASMRVAEMAAADTVAPLVRRHPAAMLGAAAVVGAVLIRMRPWRWLLRPALVGGIATQIVSQLLDRMAPPASVRNRTDRQRGGS